MREDGVLIISNHRELSDWLMMLSLGMRQGRLGVVKFFVKDIVKYVPGIGWGLSILQMVYLSRSWVDDEKKIEKAFSNVKHNKLPFWLVSFLEGTRFTKKKFEEGNDWAKQKNLKPLRNLLHPRVKGFQATISSLKDELDAVYDLTVAGKSPKFGSVVFGEANTKLHIHVKRYKISEIPLGKEDLEKWCRDKWYEKDEMLEKFKKDGKFDGKYENPLKVNPLDLYSEQNSSKKKK